VWTIVPGANLESRSGAVAEDGLTTERDRAAAIWCLPAEVSLLWQCWDEEEVIVFNRASGQTHLLDAFSAAVLRRIEASPATTSDLARFFATRFELDERMLSERVAGVCARFDELGLAEPAPP
jgi:PqqD family protein of HPr-rel-A system